jgi:SAM-dependent methyltransferase
VADYTGQAPVLAWCAPVVDLRVLELGCGEGERARQLRQAGARTVLGIDASSDRIDAARRHEAAHPVGIEYRVGDATYLRELPGGETDLVLSLFHFDALTVRQMRRCMAEVFRVLRRGGRFVFAVAHPSLPVLRRDGAPPSFDAGIGGYFSRRDGRLAGRAWKPEGTQPEVKLHHKTVEDYFEALRFAGFGTMPLVRELRVTPEILAVDPAYFGPLLDRPLHLAMLVSR